VPCVIKSSMPMG